MDLSSITQMAFYGFSMQEAAALWRPIIIFVIGVAIYSVFVYKFYRFLARKKILELKLSEYEMHPTLKKLVHGIEVVFLFPFVVFFWFFVMAVLLTLISFTQSIESIIYISVAYVSAVRIGAYYNEDLARDMAKLIPFSLLALFIIDASNMMWLNPFDLMGQLLSVWKTLVYYLVFVILLELVLRIITIRKRGKKDSGKTKKLKSAEEAGKDLEELIVPKKE